MINRNKRTLLANIFGTLGYVSCLFLWMWVTILYLPLFLENEQVKNLLLPSGEQVVPLPEPATPSPAVMIFAFVVTAAVMAVTVFVLLRIPITIAKTGKKITTKAAGSLEPLVTHGRSLPPREKKRLAASLIKLIKLLLIVVPVAAALLTILMPVALSFDIIMIVSGILAVLSLFWFAAQYISAAILGIEPEALV